MSLPITSIYDAFVSELQRLGVFESVTKHEPKSAPGQGHSVAVMLSSVQAEAANSGLNITSARITFWVRVTTNMVASPQDQIDPDMLKVVDLIYEAINGDFDLTTAGVRNVDLMGMRTETGYLAQDGKLYRSMVTTIPVIVNDVWTQG